jgi:ribokinase
MSVILNRGEDRAVLTLPGTIPALSPDHLRSLPARPARHVHVSSYYLMSQEYRDALPGVLTSFRAGGATTSVDTNWDPEERWDLGALLRQCDLFLPNEAELLAISGSPGLDDALGTARAAGCDVVVKQGARGGVARTHAGSYHTSRTPEVAYVDAVGAGDTFDAGFLAGRLSGRDVATSLAMAVIAGSVSTTARGGTTAQPTLAEVEARLGEVVVEERT